MEKNAHYWSCVATYLAVRLAWSEDQSFEHEKWLQEAETKVAAILEADGVK